MFGNIGDKLSAALEAYQRDYASRIKKPANMDAQKAAALVKEAKDIVGKSGLGPALAPTMVEHVKYWPSRSKRDDFQKRIGFPASDILASEDQNGKKDKVVGVLFTYKGQRYGIRLTDHGFTSLPDGDVYNGGKADFVANGETVLGLDISRDAQEDFGDWRWHNLYAFKVGPWTKHLPEIAAHIENHSRATSKEYYDDDILKRAQNIKLR